MPSASGDGSGPRYAPEDPTLPEPWKGLVDGSTGYLYYWNPVTNVTQYEKPVKEKLPGPLPLPPPPAKPASMSVSSSVHRGESHAEDGRSRNHQYQVGRPSGSHSLQGSGDTGHGHGHNSSHSSRASARAHGSSDAGGGLSPEEYRRQHEITIIGDDIPPPYMTFEATGFPSEILKEVHRANFAAPTPIQAQSWPIALQSRDIVAIAKTGSGKTLGYLIPGFIHLKRLRNNPRVGPTVLVLAPTRELATQIQDEADKFGRSSKISCTCVYGGAPKGPQLRDLDRGIDVVVATPGRLNDILEMRRVDLRQVSYLVLDEADRMLDMGFEPQIRKIVKEIPHRRQTLMFTATWPKEVRKIAADLLVHPVQVYIGNIDELVANKAITQYVEVIKPIEKQRRLEQILRSQEPGSKVIIFCSTKRMCDQLARTLTRQFGAAAIHGDKNQSERDRVLGHFRTGRSPILVATDVAARGLDIKDIRVVINYDFPTGVEDYVHRIGRTGRAGATGVSYTFFSDQDSKYARELVKVLEGAGQRVPPELRDMVSHGGYGGRSRRWGSGARDQGRSNGLGHGDSGYASRDGHVLPPSRRADGDRGVYRNERDSHDRCDRGRGHRDRHDGDGKVHQDSKTTSRGSIRSRSNSRSLSPRAEARGRQDTKPIPKSRVRSRSHSRSLSASPKRGPVAWSHSRSRSRSRSRSLDHAWSRCRSNSRGANRAMDRYGRSTSAPRQSPVLKKGEALAGDHFRDQSDRSQVPPHSPQRRKSSPASYDDGEIRDDQLDPSPSLRKERSRSPIQSRDDRLDSPRGLRKEGSRSPIQSRDDRLDHSRGLRKERSRSPIQSRDDRLDRPRSLRKERSRSPIQPRDDRLNRPRGLGKERSRSPIQSRDDRLNRPTRGLRKDRSRSPILSRDDQRDRPTRGLRKVRSRSPIQSTDDRLDRPCSPRKVRSRSPSQSRADRLDRPCSPRKVVRSQSPYTDNGRRGGSLSPLEWPQKSPNRANGTEGSPIGKPVQSQPLAYDGDEEEEGMIHPDEDTISPTEK